MALPAASRGSSVCPMTLGTMADHAGQVIVGEVAEVRSYWADNPRRIESEVTFQKVECLKAQRADSSPTFRLIVPSGKVGDMEMRICCAPTFAAGEKWVLFLLPTYKTFPVVGLYQGAFRIQADKAGVERVSDAFRRAANGFDKEGFLMVAGRRAESPHHRHLQAANHVRLKTGEKASERPAEAITYEDFLKQLRPVLSRSKDHKLTEPAGRRILVQYKAVPLKLSPMQQARTDRHADDTAKPSAPVRRGTVVVSEEADDRRTDGESGEGVRQ